MVKENEMIMMSEREFDQIKKEYEKLELDYKRRIELLQKAVADLVRGTEAQHTAVRVSRIDFLEMYETALSYMWDHSDEDNDIYGKDFTIHWNGIYCNCGDGAAPSNHIIPGIEFLNEEDPTEY